MRVFSASVLTCIHEAKCRTERIQGGIPTKQKLMGDIDMKMPMEVHMMMMAEDIVITPPQMVMMDGITIKTKTTILVESILEEQIRDIRKDKLQ